MEPQSTVLVAEKYSMTKTSGKPILDNEKDANEARRLYPRA